MKFCFDKKVLVLDAGGPCGIGVIRVLKGNGIGPVIALDSNAHSASFKLADRGIVVPLALEETFVRTVKEILDKYQIEIIMPCFHYGALDLSRIADDRFVNDFRAFKQCNNKYEFMNTCEKNGIPVPWTRRLKNVREIRSPVFIKPNIGTGSRNCYVVNTNREYSALREYLIMVDDFIVQEYLVGQQWTVDVLVLDGVFINALTRKDLVMRAGNTVTAEVKQNKDLEELAFNIYKKLNIRSPFNIEAIETGDGFRVIEVNARFGSGVIFTVLAGCDTISYTATRDEKYLGSVKEGIYSRYYEELYVS